MTKSPYKRCTSVLRRSYPSIAATIALVIALVGVPGVTAGGLLVTSKQIKNNSITSKDIRQSAVKTTDLGTDAVRSADIQPGAVQTTDIGEGEVGTTDIGTGQVSSADIGQGEVTPVDVTMPDPEQIKEQAVASGTFGPEFALLKAVGTFVKDDPTSVVKIDWTGTANAPASSCIFQLRVNGQPAVDGGGQVYVTNVGPESTTSVSASALFAGLPPGPHTVEVWARINNNPGLTDPCVVGPPQAGIPQSFVITELIV